jgi:hypothetical protein
VASKAIAKSTVTTNPITKARINLGVLVKRLVLN